MSQLLFDLLRTQSPSSCEHEMIATAKAFAEQFCEVSSDVMGNLYLHIGSDEGLRVMVSAHCDEVGFQIVYVDADGFAYVRKIGGIDRQTFYGSQVTVMSSKGDKVQGVFGKKAPHLQTVKEKDTIPELDGMWIDMGFTSRNEALRHISIGDHATVDASPMLLNDGKRIVGRALDNKAGVYAMLETMRQLSERKDLNINLTAVVTTQEEIGSRGAIVATQRLLPDIAICIDAGTVTDIPTVSKKERGELCLGRGPMLYRNADNNAALLNVIIEAATANGIPHQIGLGSKITGGTESCHIQTLGEGIATANISIPNRYMHSSVEMSDMADIWNTIALLRESILALREKKKENFCALF